MNKHVNWPRLGQVAPRLGLGLVMLMLGGLITGGLEAQAGPAIGLPQFQQVWDRSDKPVVEGKVNRSWTWGPTLGELVTEPYTQGGTRQVQYFDKTRMEQTEGRGVTSGLLAKEMLSGLLQLGDADFKQYPGNTVTSIVGDQNAGNASYVSFRKVATIVNTENRAPDQGGQVVTATINPAGTTGTTAELGSKYNVKNVYYDKTYSHNIADVFWNFMNQTGLIYQNGALVNAAVFDWVQAIGLPLTDAYWTRSVVRGTAQDVLVQIFERRVLTFTPSNPDQFKVEMGNVGQHYRDWRVAVTTGSAAPAPTTPAPGGTTPAPTTPAPGGTTPAPTTPAPIVTQPNPTSPVNPTQPPGPTQDPPPGPTNPPAVGGGGSLPLALNWTGPALLGPSSPQVQQLWGAAIRTRPTDGTAYMVGETGSGTLSFPANALMLARSNDVGRYTNINDTTTNCCKSARLTFASDGAAYVTWRHRPDDSGYRAYLRRIEPDGSLSARGVDIGLLYGQATGAQLDLPGLAYSSQAGKLYIVGQWQTQVPGLGFAEVTNNGTAIANPRTLATNRPPNSGDVRPVMCVDPNDNVHIAAFWGGNIQVISRVNGAWGNFTVIDGPGVSNGYIFRGDLNIACAPDGSSYVVYDGANSFGLGRYTPGQGWQRLRGDVFPNIQSQGVSVTASADNKVWVVMGVNSHTGPGAYTGTTIAVSDNRGDTFQLQRVIDRGPANLGVDIDYSSATNQIAVVSTFKEPGNRETFYVRSK